MTMQLAIVVSNKMDSLVDDDFLAERKRLRVPKDLRAALNLELDTYIYLRTKTGEIISLMLSTAYKEDAEKSSATAYATSEVVNLLTEGNYKHEIGKCETITLGCDPEILLVDRTNLGIFPANKVFRKWSACGSDGALLEFRPMPSTDEEVVVRNIYRMMIEARQTLAKGRTIYSGKIDGNNYCMMARSYYSPSGATRGGQTAGFHVHFGLPKPLLSVNIRPTHNQIVKVLDYYLGFPSLLVEGDADCYRRLDRDLEYGKPGDYRPGQITLEYRVPGAALMKHPILAIGLLAMAGVVMEDIVSRVKHCTDNYTNLKEFSLDEHVHQLYPSIPPAMEIFRCICSPTIAPIKSHMNVIRADMEKMIGYGQRAKNIENFFRFVEHPETISENAEQNWRSFYEQGQQRSMEVLR
jgi:hypothetical protein